MPSRDLEAMKLVPTKIIAKSHPLTYGLIDVVGARKMTVT